MHGGNCKRRDKHSR